MQTLNKMQDKEAREQRIGELMIGGVFAVIFVGAVCAAIMLKLWLFEAL